MNELSQDLVPRYIPSKLSRDRRRITPGRAVSRLSRSKWLASLLSAPLTSYTSHEWTRQRSCHKVHLYQVGQWSEKNRTCESSNRLSAWNWLISSLSAHLMSYVSHERIQPRSSHKVHPYHPTTRRSENNRTHESSNGLSRYKIMN